MLTLFKKEKIERVAGWYFFLFFYNMSMSRVTVSCLCCGASAQQPRKGPGSVPQMLWRPPLQQDPGCAVRGGAFLLQPTLSLPRFHHFHSDLKNLMDGLPEAMKIIVNESYRRNKNIDKRQIPSPFPGQPWPAHASRGQQRSSLRSPQVGECFPFLWQSSRMYTHCWRRLRRRRLQER